MQLCQQTHHKLSSLLKRQQLLPALCVIQCKQKASFADKIPAQVIKIIRTLHGCRPCEKNIQLPYTASSM